jgi:O-antigen biosynthesis protein
MQLWRGWKPGSLRPRKSPRVLVFFHETTWSGAPIQLLHLVTWLKSKDWEITAAVPKQTTPESGPITACLTKIGIKILPVLDLAAPPDFALLRASCQRFEIIIANTLVMWAAVRAAHDAGVPSIWYIHESLVARQLMKQIPEIQPTLSLAQILVVPTRRTARVYDGYVHRKMEVVPYGIPPNGGALEKGISGGPIFLLLGSYESRKGQDVFLDAIRQIPSSLRKGACFRLAGRRLEECFFEELQTRAKDLPNVELGDALDHKEASAAIAAADILVCASRDETMPIAILEAMSVGKPIVTTDVGGVSEWLQDGVNALIVRPEDPPALADVLQRCILEPELCRGLGAKARRTFQRNFSIDRLGKDFSRLLLQTYQSKSS